MKTYTIYKKRDGQSFKEVGSIYASNFKEAKKEFANKMTKDNFSKSNNINWLSKENDGIDTGFYDMNSSSLVYNEDGSVNIKDSILEVFCLEKEIKKGFSRWNEDVYTWAIDSKNNIDNL